MTKKFWTTSVSVSLLLVLLTQTSTGVRPPDNGHWHVLGTEVGPRKLFSALKMK
jgi:hypothetical protein